MIGATTKLPPPVNGANGKPIYSSATAAPAAPACKARGHRARPLRPARARWAGRRRNPRSRRASQRKQAENACVSRAGHLSLRGTLSWMEAWRKPIAIRRRRAYRVLQLQRHSRAACSIAAGILHRALLSLSRPRRSSTPSCGCRPCRIARVVRHLPYSRHANPRCPQPPTRYCVRCQVSYQTLTDAGWQA